MLRIIDLFAGAGGESTGIIQALDGRRYDLAAVNHWNIAIETHKRNHPDARHYQSDLQVLNPHEVVGSRDKVDLLWASPECTHHSNARGGRPRSDQSRASAWLVLKWLSECYVRRFYMENVPEFVSWGPLGADGNPLESKRGDTFNAFLVALRSLGYRVDWHILNAADYGDATTRRRFILQAVRGHEKIRWPEPTHGPETGLFGLLPWVSARDVIDWSIQGESITKRKRELAPKTLARIESGIRRHWGDWADQFVSVLRGDSVDRRGRETALSCLPFTIGQQSGAVARPVTSPVATISTAGAISLVEPFLIQYYGNGGAEPIRVPMATVTTRDRFALIQGTAGLDITFRMLQPHELAAAQGFPREYWFAGTKTEQVKQIGNAVPVNLAAAIAREGLSA